jgi:hypothetical protein
MASGHENRANRPNTWLLRPTAARVKKTLANPEPSTHGPVQAPPPSAVASGRWGAPVAGVMWPTVEDRATPRRRPQSKQVPP